MSDNNRNPSSANQKDVKVATSSDRSREIEPKSDLVIVINLLAFGLFTTVALLHSFVSTQIHREYETQMSVQQSFQLINDVITDSGNADSKNLSVLWQWINGIKTGLFEKEEETGFWKLQDSPDYLVTDFHFTTRRIKEVEISNYTSDKKWITTGFRPFSDEFDEEFEDTTPFVWKPDGTML